MTTRMVDIRTIYAIEYVPRGKRNSIVEDTSEIVPALVRVVDSLEPALVLNDWDDAEPVAYVHEGAIYESFDFRGTVDQFETYMREGDYPIARQGWEDAPATEEFARWAARDGLLSNGLERRFEADEIFKTPLRDESKFSKVHYDGHDRGVAHAQSIADRMLICGDRLFIRAFNLPKIAVTKTNQGLRYGVGYQDYASSFGDYPLWHFRCGDEEAANRFASRLQRNARIDIRDRYEWTEAGLAAEDTSAWLIINRARRMRSLLSGTHSADVMSLDTPLVNAFVGLRDLCRPYQRMLPPAGVAGDLARDCLERMGHIRDGLHEHRQFPKVVDGLDRFLALAAEMPPKPAADADDELIATMG